MKKMKLEQKGGQGTTNLQANNMTVHQGLSYSDVTALCADQIKQMLPQMREEAKKIADERNSKFQTELIASLQQNPDIDLSRFVDPNIQYNLFQAQEASIRYDSSELRSMLSKLLIQSVKTPSSNNYQAMVLSEAVATLSKLSPEMYDVLAFIFSIQSTYNYEIDSIDKLCYWLETEMHPLTVNYPTKEICLLQLVSSNCALVQSLNKLLQKILSDGYGYLFIREELRKNGVDEKDFDQLLFHDSVNNLRRNKLPIHTTEEEFLEKARSLNIAENQRKYLYNIQASTIELPKLIRDSLYTRSEKIAILFDLWNATLTKHLILTPIGKAICFTQINSHEQLDMSIWIPEEVQ